MAVIPQTVMNVNFSASSAKPSVSSAVNSLFELLTAEGAEALAENAEKTANYELGST
jgi:hypothetical protein